MGSVGNVSVIYHGGNDFDELSDDILFTTDSKEQASSYGVFKGYLHSFYIKRNAKILTIDMQSQNWKKAYDFFDTSTLTENERIIYDKYKNDPLRGIAMIAKERKYDIVKVENVNDFHGVWKGKIRPNPLATMNEYIIINKSSIGRLNKQKL